MKSLLILALILFGVFTFWACKTPKKETNNSTNIAAKADRPIIEGKWHLVRSKDTYTGKWVPRTQSETYITLNTEGLYSEKNKENPVCNGTYRVIAKEKILINKECNNAELQYNINELTAAKLVLSIQGRHGPVYFEYTKTN